MVAAFGVTPELLGALSRDGAQVPASRAAARARAAPRLLPERHGKSRLHA